MNIKDLTDRDQEGVARLKKTCKWCGQQMALRGDVEDELIKVFPECRSCQRSAEDSSGFYGFGNGKESDTGASPKLTHSGFRD